MKAWIYGSHMYSSWPQSSTFFFQNDGMFLMTIIMIILKIRKEVASVSYGGGRGSPSLWEGYGGQQDGEDWT